MTGAQAEAMLRITGGRSARLRVPGPAVPGDPGEQVGLGVPVFQDVELGPVAVRKTRAKLGSAETERTGELELLVGGKALAAAAGSGDVSAGLVLLGSGAAVVMDGVLFQVFTAVPVVGVEGVLVWRLGLRGPAAGLV